MMTYVRKMKEKTDGKVIHLLLMDKPAMLPVYLMTVKPGFLYRCMRKRINIKKIGVTPNNGVTSSV